MAAPVAIFYKLFLAIFVSLTENNNIMPQAKSKKQGFTLTKEEILNDYRIANESRQASLLGQARSAFRQG